MSNLIVLILLFVLGLALLVKYKYSYWRLRGFPEIAPQIPFGCMLPFVKKEKSALLTLADMYHKSTEAFFGIYVFFMPQLMIKDLELVRKILIYDADVFLDRDSYIDEQNDPISVNMFSQKGQKWKEMRYSFSPLFSTNKLRETHIMFQKELAKLDEYVENCVRNGETVKIKGILEGKKFS